MDLSLVANAKPAPSLQQEAAQRANTADLSNVDLVRTLAAQGKPFVVDGNEEALTGAELLAKAEGLKAGLRSAFPPSFKDLTGSDTCPTVQTFDSAVDSSANIFGYGDDAYSVARLAAHMADNCIAGDTIKVEVCSAYADFFSHLSQLAVQLMEEALPLRLAQDQQRALKAQYTAMQELAQAQLALEAAVTQVDVTVRDERVNNQAMLDEVRAIRDEMSKAKATTKTRKK